MFQKKPCQKRQTQKRKLQKWYEANLAASSPSFTIVITNLILLPLHCIKQISGEVEPSDDAIDMAEKDETRQNDNEENASDKDLTSSHQTIANEETSITDESSEHISEKSTLESVTTRDIAPEIEIKDAQTEALTSETDDRNIEKLENEEEEEEKVGA